MNWYYSQNNERRGPIGADELVSLINKQVLGSDTLVWREGLPEWLPISSVRAELIPAGATPLVAAPNAMRCVECNESFPADELVEISGKSVCARCKPLFLQKMREGAPIGGAFGLWRSKDQLVAAISATFPDRCVKCNTEAGGGRLKRRLFWHHPALYVMVVFPGLIFYALVALVVRRRATFEVGLCVTHRTKRKRAILTAWGIFLLGIAVIGAGAVLLQNDQVVWAVVTGILLGIFAAIYGAVTTRTVYAKKIDKDFAYLGGACPAFLDLLPEWQGK